MKSGASPARMGALETVRLLNLSLYITNSPLCHLICSIDILSLDLLYRHIDCSVFRHVF